MEFSQDLADVTRVMEMYFEGLYHADTDKLAKVFHPDARYINLIPDDYMNKPLTEYFEMVDRRTPPASRAEPRDDRIVSIEFGGSKMAFVRASMTMMKREYLDFLTLSHDELGWRVMTKIFTYIPVTKEV